MTKVNVYSTMNAATRLWTYIEALKTEVGGMGYAWLEDGDVVWTDTFLLPQYVSGSEVDFEATNGDAYAIEKAAKDGVLGQDNLVWVSWHSHNTMKAFWSGTDDKRIEALRGTGIKMLLSFVGNHDHDYKMRMDFFNVSHSGIEIPQVTMDDIKLGADLRDPGYAELYDDIHEFVAMRPKAAPNKPKTQAAPKPKPQTDTPGEKLEVAFEIKELVKAGLSYADAKELVEAEGEEYLLGPRANDWDTAAWGTALMEGAQ